MSMLSQPDIDIDLCRDFSDYCRDRVHAMGYELTDGVDDHKAVRMYLGICRRFIPSCPRRVLKSSTSCCPPQNLQALTNIESVVQSGGDLTPYLSTKIKRPLYNDDLLNHWGIHHLHLGVELESDGFVQRTEQILFCRFDNSNAYFISIEPHQGAWTRQALVRILHANWPKSLEQFQMRAVSPNWIADTDVRTLRKRNINHTIDIADGTVYGPIGGGSTSAGTNILDQVQEIWWFRQLRQQQQEIVEDFDRLRESASNRGTPFASPARFKLVVCEDVFCAIETYSQCVLPLRI